MKIKKLGEDKKSKRVVLEVSDATPAFMNTVRRAIVEYIPTIAIELVEFSKNDSILYDEMVANRLGLIPLKTDLKSYTVKDNCECGGEGCARCSVSLTLKTKGAGMVLSGSMKSKDPKIIPVFDNLPIVKLLKDQQIAFEAKAQLGRGHEHIKWSPGHVWYKHKENIKLDTSKIKDGKEFVAQSPIDIFSFSKGKVSIDQKKLDAHNITIKPLDLWNHDAIKIDREPNSFNLYIEPWGQLKVKEMVQEVSTVVQEQCKELQKALDEAQKA